MTVGLRLTGFLFWLASAVPLAALAPEVSLRPTARPEAALGDLRGAAPAFLPQTTVEALAAIEVQATAPMRPIARPASPQILAMASLAPDIPALALEHSLRPALRPDSIVEQALFRRRQLRRGAVCNDIEIQGEPVGAVAGTLQGCGIENAVRVRSVAGVTLSQQSVMTCETAQALKQWVSRDVEKAFGRSNRVVTLRVAAHYSCRTRNNRPGARISEHGRGKAIDISGFKLEDGTWVTVFEGWQDRRRRKPLRKIWKAACGKFGTVLGPESDRYHLDHFHLDVARHRGGAYCR